MSNQGTTLGLVGLAVPVFDTDHKIKGVLRYRYRYTASTRYQRRTF